MHWEHKVDPRWMEARRSVITASEICSCRSAFQKANEKQKSGSVVLPAFASLWLSKQSERAPELESFGAAARGHVLEPYAVDDWNSSIGMSDDRFMHHWDDCIIKKGSLGWSPDALSIPQETGEASLFYHDKQLKEWDHGKWGKAFSGPTKFLEIKSYEASHHMKCMLTEPSKLDERWQMAVGFTAVPTLEEGYLLFYSIDTDLSFHVSYSRQSLKKEIEIVKEMVDLWDMNISKLESIPSRFVRNHTESEIYQNYIRDLHDPLSLK